LSDSATARQYGDVERLNKHAPEYATTRSIVSGWFESVRRQDQAALTAFFREFNYDVAAASEHALAFLSSKSAPLVRLIGRSTSAQLIMLRDRPRSEGNDEHRVYGCACLKDDCTGEWPIARIDIEQEFAQPDWPYTCLTLDESDQHQWRIVAYPN